MSEFNVESFVARLERLGLKLTAVPLADGKFRVNRWRMMQAAENTQQIQYLWASQIGDNQARIDMLAAHLAALAPPGMTTNRILVNHAAAAPTPAASAPTAPIHPAPGSPAMVNRPAPGLATVASSKPDEFAGKGVAATVKPSATLPGMKPPTGTGAIGKTGPASTPSTGPAGAGRKANDAVKEYATINGRIPPKPLNTVRSKPGAAAPPPKAPN